MIYFAYNLFEGPTRNYYLISATVIAGCIVVLAPFLAIIGIGNGGLHLILGMITTFVQLYVIYYNFNIMFTSTRATIASLACHLKKYSNF